jgi:hypothetical protein
MYNHMKPSYFSLKIRLLFTDLFRIQFRIRIQIRIRIRIPNPDPKRLYRYRIGSGQKFRILPDPDPQHCGQVPIKNILEFQARIQVFCWMRT